MGFFDRLVKIVRAEGDSALDKIENIDKIASLDIKDMKEKRVKAQEVYASAVQQKNKIAQEHQANKQQTEAMIAKAKILKEQGNDELLMKAFGKIKMLQEHGTQLKSDLDSAEADCNQTKAAISDLDNNIRTLDQRAKTAKNRIKLQESRAQIKKMTVDLDSSSAISNIKKLEDMADEEKAKADAYTDLSDTGKSLENEIDESIAKGSSSDFEAFKNSL